MKPSKKNNLSLFKALLILQALALFVYTLIVVKNYGWDLFAVFISNINAINWSGQFNLDFNCYLILSALWIMWRNQFSIKGIIIGLTAMVLGIIFFAPYLLYLLKTEGGDLQKLLTGKRVR